MNNLPLVKALPVITSSLLICGTILLSACAGNNIVNLESSVEQLNDLNSIAMDSAPLQVLNNTVVNKVGVDNHK